MASISTLTDNFDDNSFDTSKWDRTTTQIQETNQRIEVTTVLAAQYDTLSSDAAYDLTGDQATIKVIDAGGVGLSTFDTTPLGLVLDGDHSVSWVIYGGVLRAYSNVGAGNTERATYDYDETQPILLRIRESSGTVYWDYSTNVTTPSWTNLYSATVASLFAITALTVNIVVGHWNTEVSTDTSIFDDFNILPSTAVRKSNLMLLGVS